MADALTAITESFSWPRPHLPNHAHRLNGQAPKCGFAVSLRGGKTVILKQLSKIPLVRPNNGNVLPGNPFSRVVLSSASSNWRNLLLEQHHFPSIDLELDGLTHIHDVVVMNIGRPIICEVRKAGRFQRVIKQNGAISLLPSHQPFFRRVRKDESGTADVLYLALDPAFVSRTATDLEVYPDRVELVEQQRESDCTFQHIAMALHAGVQAGRTRDRMYGEALSTALAVHLLREYGGISMGVQHVYRGLSREKLMRAVEYIHDQLHTDLTVSGIAREVHMSPYHFTRLFKQSTGQSPYRYVIEARATKAKDLLASGKFSLIEIAHDVGFFDQSHLTRQLKRLFGVTPKMLLGRRYPEQVSPKEPQGSPKDYRRNGRI